jgi:ribosomal protein S18
MEKFSRQIITARKYIDHKNFGQAISLLSERGKLKNMAITGVFPGF